MEFCAAHSASNGSGLCRKGSAALMLWARRCKSVGCLLSRDASSVDTLLVSALSSHWSGLGRSRTGGVCGGVGGVAGFQFSPGASGGKEGEGVESNFRASSFARKASLPVIGRGTEAGLLESNVSLPGCGVKGRVSFVKYTGLRSKLIPIPPCLSLGLRILFPILELTSR